MDLDIEDIQEMDFEALLSVCYSGDKYEKKVAARRLGAFRDPEAVPVLAALLYDRSGDVYESAAVALCAIGGEEAFQALAAAVQDPDPCVRRCIHQEWGLIGEPRAIPFCLNGLNDPHAGVRQSALRALQGLLAFPPVTVSDLRRGLEDSPLAAWCAAFKK